MWDRCYVSDPNFRHFKSSYSVLVKWGFWCIHKIECGCHVTSPKESFNCLYAWTVVSFNPYSRICVQLCRFFSELSWGKVDIASFCLGVGWKHTDSNFRSNNILLASYLCLFYPQELICHLFIQIWFRCPLFSCSAPGAFFVSRTDKFSASVKST